MLRRLVINKKSLVIVPVVLALALTGLFLPAREVSIEPYGMLSLESKITISIGYEAAYASPAEYLQNPSFTGGITGWTLATTTYDASVFHDSAGSIKTITAPGKGNTATGTCSQTIGIAIGSSDTVKLSLYWQKGYNGVVALQDLKAQIALPSAPTTFIDIWSDTQTGNIGWTAVADVDVSAYFTETGTYQFRYYMDLTNGNPPTSEVWAWIDNTSLDVIPAVADISNLPTSKNFGTVTTSQSYWSSGSAPSWPLGDSECYFTVTNNSGAAVDITVKGTNFTGGVGWTLASSPGENIVTVKAGKSGDTVEGDMVVLTTSEQAFITALADTASKKWEIKLETGTFTDGVPKSSTVTLTATLS